jgi:hypothetical protein
MSFAFGETDLTKNEVFFADIDSVPSFWLILAE